MFHKRGTSSRKSFSWKTRSQCRYCIAVSTLASCFSWERCGELHIKSILKQFMDRYLFYCSLMIRLGILEQIFNQSSWQSGPHSEFFVTPSSLMLLYGCPGRRITSFTCKQMFSSYLSVIKLLDTSLFWNSMGPITGIDVITLLL